MHRVVVSRLLGLGPVLLSALLLAATPACRPSIDGAWEGDAQCNADTLPLSVLINEDADGNLDGTVYIEGIFGALIARGDIDNGEYDPDDNDYNFELQTDDDDTPEFDVNVAFDDKDPDHLEGEARVLDGNGQETDQCDVDLDRVSISD